jgi:thiamine-phosphate pyrophosphorylase
VSTYYARRVDGPARRERLADSRLYFVLEAWPHGDDPRPLLDAALRGGVDIVQLREKALEDDALMAAAAPFRTACDEYGALLLLNDRPDLVAACGADGVHVGRSDTPVAEARSLVGPERLVGLSVSTLDELGDVGGADYVGVTAFATPTKEDAVAGGLELLRAAAETLTVPWFAIGGIELSNVAEVAGVGAPGVAVVRAIRDAGDPEAAESERRLRDGIPVPETLDTLIRGICERSGAAYVLS